MYFLYLRPSKKNTLGYDTMLKCVQFSSKNRYDVKMDLSIPLETLWAGFADFKTRYISAPCSHSLLFSPFNMEVVHMDRSGICVCVQHAPSSIAADGGGGGGEQQDPNVSGISSGAVPSVSYSVFVLHHGCTLTYTIPLNNLDISMLPDVRIHFSSLDGLLLAFIPGHAMQLVDCGTLHEPCHHIIQLGSEVQTLPGYELPDPSNPTLPPAITYFELIKQDNGRNAYGVAMFDVKHGVAYTYSIDTEAVFSLFTSSQATLATQVLALHLAIVHLNDAALNRRILEYFFAEGSNKLHPRLLKECLLGNSYVSMQQHSDEDEFLRLLPMTSIPTYYEELHGGAAGNDFSQQCPVHYRYSRLDPHALRDGTRGKAIQGDMYDSLRVQKSEHEVTRFSFDILQDKVAPHADYGKSEREKRRLARKEMLLSPSARKPETPSSEIRSKSLSYFKRKLASFPFGGGSKPSTPDAKSLAPSPQQQSAADSGSMSSSAYDTSSSGVGVGGSGGSAYASEPMMASPNAPPDEEARLLQKRMLHYLHLHLRRFCPQASPEQCLDWANDYHNCQCLQSTEVFRLMMIVRTSPDTVAACLASVTRATI